MAITYRSVKGSPLTSDEVDENFETLDNGKVSLTGNETIAGVKTFSSIPVLPASDPTTDNQAVRKAYVDNSISALGSIYVNVSGDTMAGDLNMGTNDITDVGSIEIENGGTIVNEAGTANITFATTGGGAVNISGLGGINLSSSNPITLASSEVHLSDDAHLTNASETGSIQFLSTGATNVFADTDINLTPTGQVNVNSDLAFANNGQGIEWGGGSSIIETSGSLVVAATGSFSLTGESDGFIASTTRIDISAPAFQFDTDLGVLGESWITGGSTSLELGFGTSGKATFDSTGFSLLQGTDNEFSITSAGANVIHDTFIGLQIGSDYVFSSDGTDSFIASTGEIGVTGDEINLTADTSASISSPAINLTGVITFFDVTDDTKALTHDVSGITTETTRTVTWPDRDLNFGSLFENGGNSFGSAASIGTNDAFDLTIKARGVDKLVLGSSSISVDSSITLIAVSNNTVITAGNQAGNGLIVRRANSLSGSSGTYSILTASANIVPTSGDAAFNLVNINPTINQTGTASGTVRGIYYNPTVTSVLGTHYAFESTSGNVLIGGGGTIQAGGYKSSDGSDGVSGTFTSDDGKTITVKDGIITSIV